MIQYAKLTRKFLEEKHFSPLTKKLFLENTTTLKDIEKIWK